MRTLLTISIISLVLTHGSTQESYSPTLTYQHGIKLEKLPIPGNKFIFKQFCTTTLDSVISTGTIQFKHSKVGKIKDCLLEWQIQHDTLITVIVETPDRKQTERALQQATLQFGVPIQSKEDKKLIYRWPTIINKPTLIAELQVDESEGSGKLTVKIKDK